MYQIILQKFDKGRNLVGEFLVRYSDLSDDIEKLGEILKSLKDMYTEEDFQNEMAEDARMFYPESYDPEREENVDKTEEELHKEWEEDIKNK